MLASVASPLELAYAVLYKFPNLSSVRFIVCPDGVDGKEILTVPG